VDGRGPNAGEFGTFPTTAPCFDSRIINGVRPTEKEADMFWYMHDVGATAVIFDLFVWLLFVAGAAVLVRGMLGRRRDRGTPEQILAHRYARGEIDDEEYRRRMDLLRQ
jgi:putative membrane protein